MDTAFEALSAWLKHRPPAWAEGARLLWVGARQVRELVERAPPTVCAVQPWRAHAMGLPPSWEVTADIPEDAPPFNEAWVMPPAQREAARGQIGRAWRAVAEGGAITVVMPNRLGASGLEKSVKALVEVRSEGLRHCKILRLERRGDALSAWADDDAPRRVVDGLWSRPGVFSWESADAGSRLLARGLPERLGRRVVDAGAGWGWLSVAILRRARGLEELHLVEGDALALRLALRNTEGAPVVGHHADLLTELPVHDADTVVTNPPFHEDGRTDPAVGIRFLERARHMLGPQGEMWIVANVGLPYEAPLRGWFRRADVVVERSGFKVLHAYDRLTTS